MFVGHGLTAFALVAIVAQWCGWEDERALQVGILAGLFATVPDVDILYGATGVLGGVPGLSAGVAAFWETGNVVHRGPTHSLLVGAVAAVAFAAVRRGTIPSLTLGTTILAGVVATVASVSGLLAAALTAVFLAGGLCLVLLAIYWDVRPRTVGLVALAGLLSHPFGDLFTGAPPAMFYPLDGTFVSERVAFHGDATLHLLGAFTVELAVVWVALLVAISLSGRSVQTCVDRRAVLGLGYGVAVLLLPAPTLDASYQFVFSILALGVVGVPLPRIRRVDLPVVACTGVAAVTCAAVSYTLVYVVV